MKQVIQICMAITVAASLVFGTVDQDPKNAGTSITRNATGTALDAPITNPALLGTDRVPRGGFQIFPLTNLGLGYWSDKLALNPFTVLWDFPNGTADMTSVLTSDVLKNSFDIKSSDSPDQVSSKLTKGLKNGVSLYAGSRTSLLNFAQGRVGINVTTHADQELHIPEGPLYAIFSADKGLLRGNTLDFSNFRQDAIWATDVTFQLGLPVSIPALNDFFGLKYGAGGIGVKYVMGHSVLHAETKSGTLTYDKPTNSLSVDGEVLVQTAGTGFKGAWDWKSPGFPINGHGLGVEIGGILYDEKGAFSINVENLGVLFWINNVSEVTYKIKKSGFDAYDIIKGIDNHKDSANMYIFNRNANEYLSDRRDSLVKSNGFVTFLPLALNIGYAYTWRFTDIERQPLRLLADHTTLGANYQQQLAPGPGRSFIPRLSLGGEAGLLRDYIPVRMGWIFGGPEEMASNLGFGFNFRYLSIDVAYKALGSVIFWPQRGFEAAGGITINWGVKPKAKPQKCRIAAPQNFAGALDSSGCPNPDQDRDGICDPWVSQNNLLDSFKTVCKGIDACPTDAEDKDGFQDEDGCPDPDNDSDGVCDPWISEMHLEAKYGNLCRGVDLCPDLSAGKDPLASGDGCPVPDHDNDGICDQWVSDMHLEAKYANVCTGIDQCPTQAEDLDGFEDDNGCPDLDNDKDGIPDSVDQCINQPETYNGYKDQDGCPDTIVKPTEKETKALNTKLRAINFKTASAELTSDSYTALNFIVGFLKQYSYLRYEIEGHTDSQGADDYNLVLSAARAGSVRNYLVSQSIPDSNIIAIGYGKTRPIDVNTTAKGRAMNRRVEFHIIDTRDEYNDLKRQEADFQERIRAAKIKGAGY